jgi:hypothetical protein
MFKVISNRLALIIAPLLVFIAAFTFGRLPVFAAPSAQTSLPDFTINAQTVLTVTVAITGGQVIVIPVDLAFVTQSNDGETDVSLIADVEQQAGIFIGVAPSTSISATIETPQSQAAANATAAPSQNNSNVEGTHVANRNANRRAGPGTNFQIVGRVGSGEAVTVVGANNDGTWLELEDGSWVAEFLLDPVANATPNSNNDDNNNDDNGDDNNDDGNDDSNNDQNDDDQAEAEPTPTTEPVAVEGDIATYLANVIAIGTQANNAVDTLNALIENPQPFNADWLNEAEEQLGALANALDQYLALTPVPGYEDLHAQVTNVALTCEQAVDYLFTGLDNPLAIEPGVATQSVQACAAEANALAGAVEALQ